MDLSASSIESEVKKFELPIGFLGFWAGVDQKWGTPGNSVGMYPYTSQGFGDMLAGVGGQSLAKAVIPGWTGAAQRTFKLQNVLTNNKALVPLVVLYAGDKIAGTGYGLVSKIISVAASIGIPFGLGWSVGTVFDAESIGNPSGATRSGAISAQYTNGQQVLPA